MFMKVINYVLLPDWASWECAYVSSGMGAVGEEQILNRFISVNPEPVAALGGLTAVPDGTLEYIPSGDALVLVGGLGWRTDAAAALKDPVIRFLETGKPVGAICAAADFLASLGVLNDRKHTGNGVAELEKWGGKAYSGQSNFVERQAVRDGNLVTANGTGALEFAREMMLAVGLDAAKVDQWYKFHKDGFFPA